MPDTTDPVAIVEDFLKSWMPDRHSIHAAIRRHFTEATVYENVGLSTTTGPEEAVTLMERFRKAKGMEAIDIEILAIGAQGGTVLTERVDHLIDANGKDYHAGRCMGVFEVKDGKITAWRDYFDTAGFTQAMQQPGH